MAMNACPVYVNHTIVMVAWQPLTGTCILESKGYKAMSERLIICSDFRWKGTVLKAKMTPLGYERQTEGKKFICLFFLS